MKIGKVFLLICLILISIEGYSQGWIQQNSGVSSSLKKIVFVNSNTGFVCGSVGKILKTTNGGTNWSALTSGTSNDLYSITFADSVNLWACGASGTIIKTTNGGTNWSSLASNTTVTLRSIFYSGLYSSNFALNTCGDNGVVLATVNAGANWFPLTNSSTQALNTVYFPNIVTGFAFGNNGTVLYTTGSTFAQWTFPNSDNILDSKGTFFSIILTTSGGKVAKSFNNGGNWNLISTGTTNALNGVAVKGKKVWVAGAGGTVRYSNDSGYTWQAQVTNITSNLNSIFMTDTLHGWIAGDNGFIASTSTGGTIGINTISTKVPSEYSLFQNFPNPFNPSTKIRYQVSVQGNVILKVFDISGREIANLVNEKQQPGTYEVLFEGLNLSSGVYFYTLNAGSFSDTKRMIVLK